MTTLVIRFEDKKIDGILKAIKAGKAKIVDISHRRDGGSHKKAAVKTAKRVA